MGTKPNVDPASRVDKFGRNRRRRKALRIACKQAGRLVDFRIPSVLSFDIKYAIIHVRLACTRSQGNPQATSESKGDKGIVQPAGGN